jgi:hypothetical protein
MPVKTPLTGLLSVRTRQKFGEKFGYGSKEYGTGLFGDPVEIAGLYAIRHSNGKIKQVKMNFYPYVIVHNEAVDNNRTKFKNAVTAWQGLAPAEKSVYNKRAVGRHYHGYQLFIREYMLL